MKEKLQWTPQKYKGYEMTMNNYIPINCTI